MPIHTFENESEYNAHTKSTAQSEISLVKDTNVVKFDGVNVETLVPTLGDALYLEDNLDSEGYKIKHFIKGETLNSSLLPSNWTPVAAVVYNHGGKVLLHYYKGYNNGDNTEQWASAWLYELTGMTIDGNEHSIVFRQPKSSGYLTVGTFTYTSTDIEAFCSDLDEWLRNNQGGTSAGGTWDYKWHCEYMENYLGNMSCIVIVDNIVDYRQYGSNGIVDSGCTANANMSNMIPEITSYQRNNEGSGYRTGLNYERMLEYWQNNTTISNPTSNISIINSNDIVSKTQFENNQYCQLLRDEYETYEKYIESLMLKYPTLKRGIGKELNNSAAWNKLLSNKTHKNINGVIVPTFKPFYWANTITFNSKGIEQGDWYVPSAYELYEIVKDIKYGLTGVSLQNSDLFNRTLNKMGGTPVSCSQHRWSVVRSGYRNAWCFGSAGSFIGNLSFYNSFRVSAVSLVWVKN